MKYPKRIIGLTAIVLLISAAFLIAQKKGGDPAERAAKKTERLAEKLNLSPEQIEQVTALHLAQAEKRAEARKNGNKKEKGDKAPEKAAFLEEMKGILTPEQFATFETLKPEKGRKGKGRKGKKSKGEKDAQRLEQN